MIIKFKIFEKLDKNEPKKGDYVICHNPYYSTDENNYLMSKIAQIYYISYMDGKPLYNVKFDEYIKLPNYRIEVTDAVFWRSEIKHWSENKAELEQFSELYNDITKFNL